MARIEDEIKMNFESDKHKFMTNIIFTAHWFLNQFDELLKPYGLSNQQFNVLRILRGAKKKGNEQGLTMNTIKGLMVDKSPNTTRLSNKLIDKELIERERSCEDRRVVYLKITTKGMDFLAELDDIDNGTLMGHLENITDEEAAMVSNILDKFRG